MRAVVVGVRLAFRALLQSGLRSLLTVLGILIGIAAVVVVVAIGEGASEQVGARIESLGSNVVYVFSQHIPRSGARSAAGTTGVTLDDAAAVARDVTAVSAVTVYSQARRPVVTPHGNAEIAIVGADLPYFQVRAFAVASGRTWTPTEERTKARVCLLGPTAADKLFESRDPVGHTLRIGAHPYLVVGLLESKGASPFGDDQDDRVLMPMGTFVARIVPQMGRRVQIVMASARSAGHTERAVEQIEALLRQRHHLGDSDEADFRVSSQDEFRRTQERVLGVLQLLLVAVALVSLFVGGVGVMNIMLVGVAERRREIGLRMALGARAGDIQLQFLLEAMVLTLAGGLAGVVLAFVVIASLIHTVGWNMALSPNAVILALGTSAIIGLCFGLLPAHRAARLEPMEALRHE